MTNRQPTQALLARISRYGLSRLGRQRRTVIMLGTSCGAMASGIAARYAVATRRWPLLDFVLEQRAAQGANTSVVNQFALSQVFLSPRVLLQLLVGNKQQVVPAVSRSFERRSSEVQSAALALAEIPASRTVRSETNVVERAIRRTLRHENELSTRQTASTPGSPSAGAAPRAYERFDARPVFRRTDVQIDQEKKQIRSNPQGELVTAWQSKSKPESSMPSVLDIGRITQQVMQAIDQKVVAHRERMGRE